MSQPLLIRLTALLTSGIFATTSYTALHTHTLLERNHEEAEARMDELEGTLRGHIGIIEEALDRLEQKAETGGLKVHGLGERASALYGGRGRDEKNKKKEEGEK